jgi:hypothetical protein
MTDAEIDEQIARLRAMIRWLEGQKRAPQHARDPSTADLDAIVTITPGQAAGLSGMSESQVRRDCEANPYDAGGFGIRTGGRWRVARDRYVAMRCARLRALGSE